MRTSTFWLVILSALLLAFVSAQTTSTVASERSSKPRVELPPGWVAKPPTIKIATQFAQNTEFGAFFVLIVESSEDFADDLQLKDWAKLVKQNAAKNAALTNRKETEIRSGKVAGRETAEYEFTGVINGVKLHYRSIMVRSGDYFCNVLCWTTPSHWDEAQAKFEEIVGRLK